MQERKRLTPFQPNLSRKRLTPFQPNLSTLFVIDEKKRHIFEAAKLRWLTADEIYFVIMNLGTLGLQIIHGRQLNKPVFNMFYILHKNGGIQKDGYTYTNSSEQVLQDWHNRDLAINCVTMEAPQHQKRVLWLRNDSNNVYLVHYLRAPNHAYDGFPCVNMAFDKRVFEAPPNNAYDGVPCVNMALEKTFFEASDKNPIEYQISSVFPDHAYVGVGAEVLIVGNCTSGMALEDHTWVCMFGLQKIKLKVLSNNNMCFYLPDRDHPGDIDFCIINTENKMMSNVIVFKYYAQPNDTTE